MPTFNFPNASTPDAALTGLATAVPVFPIMILVFTWLMVFLTGVMKQNQRSGAADLPQWATLASLSIVLLSLVMSVKEGMITLPILVVVMSVTVLCGIWFFFSRGRFE